MKLEYLIAKAEGPQRWVNLPFILILVLAILLGAHDGISGILFHIIILPVFVVQLIRPTLLGWLLTLIAWSAITFIIAILLWSDRRFLDASQVFWALLWGPIPLSLLYFFRPAFPPLHKARAGADSVEPS